MTKDTGSYHLYILVECPFCEKAVKLLQQKKAKFAVTVLDNHQEMLEKIKQKYSHKTVPIVVKKTDDEEEVLIGGCSDLEQSFNA
jgi:glutaredoxin